MISQRQVDHIVYAVPNLTEAINWFEKISGIHPITGGHHANQGTKNALVNLGNGCYLELITIDKANTKIKAPRWMGVDLLKGQSRITRWSLKSDDLPYDSSVLKKYHPAMGVIHQGQRKTTSGKLLSWQMTLPLAEPLVEAVPFLTDWQTSDFHPTDQMPEQCKLVEIMLSHPYPGKIQPTLTELQLQLKVERAAFAEIKIEIDSPRGIIRL